MEICLKLNFFPTPCNSILAGFTAFIMWSVSEITMVCFGKFWVNVVKLFNLKATDKILTILMEQISHDVYNHSFMNRLIAREKKYPA